LKVNEVVPDEWEVVYEKSAGELETEREEVMRNIGNY